MTFTTTTRLHLSYSSSHLCTGVTLGVQLTPEKLCAYNVRSTIDPLFISGTQSTKTPAMVADTTFMFAMGLRRANVIRTEWNKLICA